MNISIIIPEQLSGRSFLQPPWGILLVKSILEVENYHISLIDNRIFNYPTSLLIKKIEKTDIIVIPTTLYDCMQHYWLDFRLHIAFFTINAIKKAYPTKKVIIIGSHGTVRPDLIMRDTLADIVIKGEYEKTLPLLVNSIKNNNPLNKVPNIYIRDKQKIVETQFDNNLYHPQFGEIDFPKYTDINFNLYYHDLYKDNIHSKGRSWGVLVAGKGCTYKCTFCFNFFSSNVRRRTPESVVNEMEILEKRFKLQGVYFLDSTFTLNKKWVFEICRIIKSKKLKISWGFETRCDLLSKELLLEVKSANCSRILIGIESFSDTILKRIKKDITSKEILNCLANIKDVGLETLAFINIGLPGETIETLQTTLDNIHSQKLFYTKSIIIAQPKFGTEYYNTAKKQFPNIGNSWNDLLAITGIVDNEMTPSILEKTVNLLRSRDFIYSDKCPSLKKILQ